MHRFTFLTDSDVERIGAGVVHTLDHVGALFQSRDMLQALDEMGARVDHEQQRATFPPALTERFVGDLRRERARAQEDPEPFRPGGPPGIGTQVAQFFYDYGTGERRPGNREDLTALVKLGAVLHPERAVGHALLLTEEPPLLEPLAAGLVLAEYAPIPGAPFAWNVRQIEYLVEMGELLGIDHWFTYGANCIAHPLRFDRDVADRFVLRVREGGGAGLTSMPVAGVSTPVSAAGFIIVSAAEMLAAWMVGRALNPDTPLSGSMYAGTADMRTGEVSYCAFDAMRYALAFEEFIRRWTGQRVGVGSGEYCDAKEPGYYAAMEKAHKSMTIAAFTGRHPTMGQGMLEEGKTMCPVQLLLERELTTGAKQLGRGVATDEAALSLPLIEQMGFALHDTYLTCEDTMLHYRDHLWQPRWMDRSGWRGVETDRAVLSRLQGRVAELTDAYEKPERPAEMLEEMRQIVQRAHTELYS